MMISDKSEQIKARLLEFTGLLAFQYHGLDCDIDPFDPEHFHITCNGVERDVHSIDDVMNGLFFDGHCLREIAGEIQITEW